MKLGKWEIRRDTETRSITIGPSTSVGLPYGGLSSTLSSEQAMRLSAVYRCVDVISDSIATMPFDVMTFTRAKEWVKSTDHLAYSILNSQPNPAMSSFTFFKTAAAKVLLDGNAYIKIFRDFAGNPTQLELCSGAVVMYLRNDLSCYYTHKHPYTNAVDLIEGDDMVHLKNFSYDGLLGVSTITHAANITGIAAAADGQASGFFSGGANMNGILTVPGKITSAKATELKTAWAEAVQYDATTGKSGGIAVLEGGAEFKPISVNPRDAQMLETRQFNVIDICRFFGVSPIKAFDVSSATYANVESYQLGYITDTITPFATKIDNEFNRKLLRPSQRSKTYVKKDINALMSADLDTRANYYSKMFQLGTYSPDDICRELHLPVDPSGNGGKRYVQVNLTELGKTPEPIQNKNTNTANDEGNTQPE